MSCIITHVLSVCVCTQIDVKDNEATSFIFESDDARTVDKLMVLIHGSGVVRAGQWARRYICMILDNL